MRYAIEALANAGDARAVEPLRKLAGDERQELRELAEKALGIIS